jgi:hypothetical protein
VKAILQHPLLPCLDSFNDSKATLKNIENNLIELGEYKELVQVVLKLKMELSTEAYQGFIFFLINEDIDNKGIYNVCKNSEYRPISVKNLLNKIIDGNQLTNDEIKSISLEIKTDFNTNYSLNTLSGELNKEKTSKFALNDSGFISKLLDLFLHIHSAQDTGNNQNEQQPTTTLTLNNKSISTVGVTVLQKSVAETKNALDYLYLLQDKFNFNIKEKIFLTNLQFDSSYVEIVSSLVRSKKINIDTSDLLSTNFTLLEDFVKDSANFALTKLYKSDFENIIESKSLLMKMIKENGDFFNHCLKNTSTDNSKLFQHISGPTLTYLKSILNIELTTKREIFTSDDINAIVKLLSFDDNIYSLNNNKLLAIKSDIDGILSFRENIPLEKIEQSNGLVDYVLINERTSTINSHLDALLDNNCDYM